MSFSCTREVEMVDVVSREELMEFRAAWADANPVAGSRTVLADNGEDILWTAGEEINVFYGSRSTGKFTSSNTEPQAFTTFSGTLTMVTGSVEQGNESSRYWAVYPYNEANTCDDQNVILGLPDQQSGKNGSFADKFFPSVAVSATPDLAFYNVCGGARFSVTQEGIVKAVFKSNDGSPMAGKVKVGFGDDNKPQILEFAESVDSVVVTAPDGGFSTGENYFAAMLPQAHGNGMTITLYTQDKKASRTLDNAVEVHRSVFGVLDNVDNGLTYERFRYLAPEIVDLGLSVKWASFNLGATRPEEYGDYFAWGETEPKENYSWATYKWGNPDALTKYCTKSSQGYNGFTDNKTVLDPEDDAAAVALGGSWRIPTNVQLDELLTNCTWTWTSQKDINGYLVTGPNGNSIFLPAAGGWSNTTLYDVSSFGFYQSSSLYASLDAGYPEGAYWLDFQADKIYVRGSNRNKGLSVRPVSE